MKGEEDIELGVGSSPSATCYAQSCSGLTTQFPYSGSEDSITICVSALINATIKSSVFPFWDTVATQP